MRNGLKIVWGQTSTNVNLETVNLTTLGFPTFTSATSYKVMVTREKTATISSGGGIERAPQVYKTNGTQFVVDQYKATESRTQWFAIGY